MDSFSIIWSLTAKISYYQILEYLNDKWTIKELKAFVKRTEDVLVHVYKTPLIYPYSKESDTYKCVVVKQVSLFYRIKGNRIELPSGILDRIPPK